MRDYDSLFGRLLFDLELPSDFINGQMVLSDQSPVEVAKVQMANSFYKKLCPTESNVNADKNALEKFERLNERLDVGPWNFIASNEPESCFYDYFKNNLAVALQPECTIKTGALAEETGEFEIEEAFDLDFIREHMMVGPGAAQKADSTSMVHKLFNGEMSYYNPDLIRLYRSAVAGTGFWADAEKARFEKFGFTPVSGGKLFFASKNAEISRVCGTEANMEMLIQKAAGAFLECRLERHFGINLSDQPDNNRELARLGSISGSFGTMDLVSASDCIGLTRFCRYFPDGNLKTIILASRSESVVTPDGRDLCLQMVSTMGNGFTFPLQTIIFASVVRAAYQVMGFPCVCPKTQFAVFGDDIIVRREAYEFVARMLVKLGFEVNMNKSFNAGPFRESCGSDYFNGYNVRGVYVKSLEAPQEVYSIINRLLRWGARHGCYLKTTLQLLRSWVREIRIPPSEADDAGIKVPARLMPSTRVNNAYWFQYRCYVRRVSKVDMVEPDDPQQPCNPDGVAVGFLSGHLRRRDFVLKPIPYLQTPWHATDGWGFPVSKREAKGARARYKIAHKSIPWWDYQSNPKISGQFLQGDTWRELGDELSYAAWEGCVVATLSD